MLCPVCNTEMIIQELHEVEVDHCLSCHGIWLDQGELQALMQQDGDDAHPSVDFSIADSREHTKKCPVCRRTMEKWHAGNPGDPVLIDQCTRKHGIWFDAGELHHLTASYGDETNQKLTRLLREMFAK